MMNYKKQERQKKTGNRGTDIKLKYIYAVLVIVPIILYANTFSHNYALDDQIVITGNKFVKEGFAGIGKILSYDLFAGYYGPKQDVVIGGRYRPLSLITFAIEYQLFGENPHLSHIVNVLLYTLSGLLIYIILTHIFVDNENRTPFFSIPFLTALLFIAHPLHTEAVANIKGRDEILSFLFSLLALWYQLKYFEKEDKRYLLIGFMAFFLALLSKESAVVFVVLIPITFYFFNPPGAKRLALITAPLLIASLLFIVLRQSVIDIPKTDVTNDLMNNPFVHASTGEKYATIAYTFGVYLKLLFFPHPLTYDYYPFYIPILDWTDLRVIISVALYIGLAGVAVIYFKRRNVVSYAIIFYFLPLTLVSNIFFPIGAFMAERFLYASVFGFALIISYLAVKKGQVLLKYKYLFITLLLIILAIYSIKTVSRNQAWKDNLTLFTTDAETSFTSAKSTEAAGEELIRVALATEDPAKKKQFLEQAIKFLTQSLWVHPEYKIALNNIGVAIYEYNKDYAKIFEYYKRIFELDPGYELAYKNLDNFLADCPDLNMKKQVYEYLYSIAPNRFSICYNLGILYGKDLNSPGKAISFLEKAVAADRAHFDAIMNLGVAYYKTGDFDNALKNFDAAYRLRPGNWTINKFLGTTYQRLGLVDKAQAHFDKMKMIEAEMKKK